MSTAPHRLGKYEFQQFLGKGNVGEVWKARDLSKKRDVALKTVYTDLQRSDPQFLTRFMTDGQVLVTLRHANLLPTLEVNITRQEQSNEIIAYLATEYVEGQTLTNYLQNTSHKSNFPALPEIVHFFISLGNALDYAYKREIVHGNLTPDNILLNKQDTANFPAGKPMLTDIGLAQILGSATSTHTKALFYLSPEQAQGYPPSPRSDVYALGIILYEIYTGTVPFHGESSVAIISQHIRKLPTPPTLINPIVPPVLSEVILRAIAKDPVTRFDSVSTFAAAIAAARATQSLAHGSEQLPHQGTPNPPIRQGNSLLGVAQPPLPSGTTHFRYSSIPLLSDLPFSETPAQASPIPSTPPSLFLPAQPNVTKPLPHEANKSTPLPQLPQLPQPPVAQTQSPMTKPGSVEPGKPKPQTQPISPFPIPQAQPISLPPIPKVQPTSNPNSGASTSQTINMSYAQQDQSVSIPQASPMPQFPPPPQVDPRMPGDAQPPQPIPAIPAQRKPNKSTLYVGLAALLAFVIIGGGLLLLLNKGNANQTALSNGNDRVFFQDGTLHNDQLHIDMQGVAPPPDGQTYFAWLQDTNQQTHPLGPVSVQNGNVSFLYQGDSKHTNLISITQGILITTEDTGNTPQGPSDHKVYQASFDPQLLNGLKSLLYATPDLPGQQSIVATILDTLHSIDDKAGSIVDSLNQDNALAMRQATRIIETLDNSQQARSSGDLPAKYASQASVSIGLLSSPSQQGYLDILDSQIKQLEPLVANNTNAQQHLTNVKSGLEDLRDWLQKMHDDDVQLLKASDLQDPGIPGIALQLKQVSADSFTGHTMPPNASPQPIVGSAGAQQIYAEAQYMATLSLQPA